MTFFHLSVIILTVYLLTTMDSSLAKINVSLQLEAAVSDGAAMSGWAYLQTSAAKAGIMRVTRLAKAELRLLPKLLLHYLLKDNEN